MKAPRSLEPEHHGALFGFTKSERLDFNRFLQQLHPEDREAVRLVRTKAIEGRRYCETEYRVVLSALRQAKENRRANLALPFHLRSLTFICGWWRVSPAGGAPP